MHVTSRLPLRLVSAALVCRCLCCATIAAAERNSSYLAALESIRVDELKGYVDYLADDKLEGREAGRRGGRKAGDYLAERFRQLGLEAAGVDGGFFQPFGSNFRNVLAWIRGSDAELKNCFVIVSAHYDHIGYGTRRTSRGPIGYIHNGADDNASGVSALLEVAEAFTMLAQPPKRSVLFAAWDAEEKGLLGSKHWLGRPTVPLDRVAAVLNMDMIGRLREDRLMLFGWRSGRGLRRLVSRQNEGLDLLLDFPWAIKRKADHYPFFQHDVPVLMMHTGLHDQYHTPYDDAKLIDAAGINRVARLAFHVVHELADRRQIIEFRRQAERETQSLKDSLTNGLPKLPDRLGIGWQPHASSPDGLRITRVTRGSSADEADLRPGDRIVRFAGREIHGGDDLMAAVMAAQSPAEAIVRRPGNPEPLELSVQLRGKPMRLGISWRVDDAEPGTIILTRVVPGSPAARDGLRVGDRIHQIAGRDFADEAEFARLAKTLPEPLTLLVQRDGQLSTIVLHVDFQPMKRAA